MKHYALKGIRAAVIVVSLLGLSASAAATKDAKKAPAGATGKTAPADAAKTEEPMGKVEGLEVQRGKSYFGIELVGGNFKITFYDAKRHVVASPFARAALRWPVNYRPADERTVLNVSGDAKSLSSPKVVKPPYQFKLFITFLADGADENAPGMETYTVDFKG